MPTENRSSNTDPRDVFIRLNPLGLGEAELRKDSTGFEDQRTHSDYLLFLAGYRETHAEPQHHPEPIAWMVGTAFWWTKEEAERDAAATGLPVVGLGPMTGSAPAEQHQGEPVALPERIDEKSVNGVYGYSSGWNACLDEIAKLGPLYIHPNPNVRWEAVANEQVKVIGELKPEVERLRAEIEDWNRIFDMQEGKIDALRAKLTEAHALLREIRRKPGLFSGDFILRLDEILSASAEPRPFRIPDCPDCACVQDGQCLCSPSKPSAEPSAPVERGTWLPLSAPGQIQEGDWLCFTVQGSFICARACLIIDPGTDKEEIVYNRKKNHYFCTDMAIAGTSNHKRVLVARAALERKP
ncbi:hypothetical protein [Pseudomonas juntendi]|uniref:hypothetical protein n=1 Tax=Pseudomonas juntendi TaxID=2666183 RepID=UPI003B962E8F